MNEIAAQITKAVEEFASNDLAYSDNALVKIDPKARVATLVDPDDDEDIDAMIDADPNNDYVSVMDLVEANPDDPGRWIADADAISEVAAEYQD